MPSRVTSRRFTQGSGSTVSQAVAAARAPRHSWISRSGLCGESYVSMAVSYWQVDRREDALDLCRRGIDCMVSAVDAKQLDEPALALAYDNLSKMYAELGEDERSRTYAEMASRAEASGQRR